MRLTIFCSTILFLLIHFRATFSQPSTLKLVQVLYRHGDRSPTMTFPKDQWIDYWTDGRGQITKLGKQQQFALGQYFRQRYANFLSTKYRSEDIRVRSTDSDRTLNSAYCNLAGLYPPVEDQIWNQTIRWQPIPVHTLSVFEDEFVTDVLTCAKIDELYKTVEELPVMKAATARLMKLSPFVSNETGALLNNPLDIEDLYNFFLVLKIHNLWIPDWADFVMNEIELYYETKETSYKNYPEIFKLRGGPMLNEMITNMENKIVRNITQRMFMYSAHDATIIGLLQALQVYDDINPPYCAAVMVELHEDDKKEKFVQVFYRNTTTGPPLKLSIPNCSSWCEFQKFKDLTANMVVHDFNQECKGTSH